MPEGRSETTEPQPHQITEQVLDMAGHEAAASHDVSEVGDVMDRIKPPDVSEIEYLQGQVDSFRTIYEGFAQMEGRTPAQEEHLRIAANHLEELSNKLMKEINGEQKHG